MIPENMSGFVCGIGDIVEAVIEQSQGCPGLD